MRKIIIILLMIPMILTGSGQQTNAIPNAIITKSSSTVQFPKATEIQHVYVIAGLAGILYVPKNQSETVSQIERRLKTAKSVYVQFPKPKPLIGPPIEINANTNPAVLELRLSSKKLISISPTFYVERHSQKVIYHFVDGVISYQVGNKTVYFKAPELYNWLKSNQWHNRFNIKSEK